MKEAPPLRLRVAPLLKRIDAQVLYGDAFLIRGGERGLMVVQLRGDVGCTYVKTLPWNTDQVFQSWLTFVLARMKGINETPR